MDNIKRYLISLCFCAVFSALIMMLAPKGSHKKMLGFVVNGFFLLAIVSPISKGLSLTMPDVKPADTNHWESNLTEEIELLTRQKTEEGLAKALAEELRALDVEAKKISVNVDTTGESSISISKILIVLDRKYALSEIKIADAVMQNYRIQPRIVFE